jgi:thioredoxin reductase (NADPH)
MIQTKVIIIGSGPAGWTAAIYLGRSAIPHVLIKGPQPGGQLFSTTAVENYPGFESIMGPELMTKMEEQAKRYGTIVVQDKIISVNFQKKPFYLNGEDDDSEYQADSVIIATGASAKWLGLDSEAEYQGYGVSSCATCDGYFCRNKKVCVVGGGNTALTEALHLAKMCKKVIILHRNDRFYRPETCLIDRVEATENIETIHNTELIEVFGRKNGFSKSVEGVMIKTKGSGIRNIKLDGVFIAIGHQPNTGLFKSQLDLTSDEYILTHGDVETSIKGIYAAGDVQDRVYKQAVTAAANGCQAALKAIDFIETI